LREEVMAKTPEEEVEDIVGGAAAALGKKEWKDKIISGAELRDDDLLSISTNSVKLDLALKRPFVEGSVVEIYGDNSTGKTTLALEVASNAMLMGKQVYFIDLERKLREAQLIMIKNFNREKFAVLYPDTGEETIDMMHELILSTPGCVIILDSVSGLLPEVEDAEDASKQTMGVVARLCHKLIRKVTGIAARNKCLLIFLNHKTASMQAYGPSDTVHGGKAIVNRAAQRIEMTRNMSGLIKKADGDEVLGQMVRCKVIKNNVNRPFISVEIPIIYGKGIDSTLDMLQLARDMGIVPYNKGWYTVQIDNEEKRIRESQLYEMITASDELRGNIVKQAKVMMGYEA
jgi:recombination protein RecA